MTLRFSPIWHYVFDALSFLAATIMFRCQSKEKYMQTYSTIVHKSSYWYTLCAGIIVGAYVFGTVNLSLGAGFHIGHSIVGALFGGIAAIEILKWKDGVRESTGAMFVPSICVGIVIGRLGCFFSGLVDQTYGIESNLPWAIDMGDGLRRHPVALYESFAMLFFILTTLKWKSSNFERYRKAGFYAFVLFYSSQRFFWEFLKPYSVIFWRLNLFHILCISLFLYATYMLWRTRERSDVFKPG